MNAIKNPIIPEKFKCTNGIDCSRNKLIVMKNNRLKQASQPRCRYFTIKKINPIKINIAIATAIHKFAPTP